MTTPPSLLTRLIVVTVATTGLWLSTASPARTQTPAVTVTPTTLTVTEGDATTYTVVLTTTPTTEATITPTTAPTNLITISGPLTFSTTNWNTAQTVTITTMADGDSDTNTITISHTVDDYDLATPAPDVKIIILEPPTPTFGPAAVGRLVYVPNTAIRPLTLPAATGGTSTLTYALTGTLPDGLTLNTNTRTLTGTPNALTAIRTYTWTATDPGTNRSASLTFTIEVLMTSVCGRTPGVRDAIVMAIDGVTDCADATMAHLRAISTLNFVVNFVGTLRGHTLQSGDFDGLSGLQTLLLSQNAFTSLPEDLFTGLSALEQLDLDGNRFTTLPDNLFNGLNALTMLNLETNTLTSLPDNLFNGLSALEQLRLSNNRLPTLPAGIFTGLSALRELHLFSNRLATLPAGIFNGLSALEQLYLSNNQLPSLSAGLFNGLSALQQLHLHNNQLATLPAGLFNGLSALQQLRLHNNQLATLPEDLFDGLSALVELDLDSNALTTLPEDLFDGLSTLEELHLSHNQLTTLPENLFDGLSALSELYLLNNQWPTLPAGLFNGLRALEQLWLSGNTLMTTLPAGLFNGLRALEQLWLNGNTMLTTLPAGLFNGLHALEVLNLESGGLTTLSEGLFDGLMSLRRLALHGNPDAPFTLSIDIQRQANGQARARIPEAAPSRVEVTWTIPGTPGASGTATIPAGQRTSAWFGMTVPANTELSAPRFPDVTDTQTDDEVGSWTGIGLATTSPRAGLIFSPTALTVDEGDRTSYTVRLNTEPTGQVTVTPDVAPGSDLTVTGALTFTMANWLTDQTVTVSTTSDIDETNDTVTITHTVNGYMPVTSTLLRVTITDLDANDTVPGFTQPMVADQTYRRGTAITPLMLPVATGGNGRLSYTLSGTLPGGLTYANRVVTGTPTMTASAVTLTWTVSDADRNRQASDTTSLTFTMTVIHVIEVTITPTALTVGRGRSAAYTVVLAAAPVGDVTVTPRDATGTGTISGPLTFSVSDWNTAQSVTVMASSDPDAPDTVTITHEVISGGSVTAADNVVVTIKDELSFGTAAISPQRYFRRTFIPVLTLPAARNVSGDLRYALIGDLPRGLTVDTTARTLAGMPVSTLARTTYT